VRGDKNIPLNSGRGRGDVGGLVHAAESNAKRSEIQQKETKRTKVRSFLRANPDFIYQTRRWIEPLIGELPESGIKDFLSPRERR
jgi:hypothetical protein